MVTALCKDEEETLPTRTTMLALLHSRPAFSFFADSAAHPVDLLERVAKRPRSCATQAFSAMGLPGLTRYTPSLELYRDRDHYIATCALPGVKREQIRIELLGNRALHIKLHHERKPRDAAAGQDSSPPTRTDLQDNQGHGPSTEEPSTPHSVVVATLPQAVDASGISCAHQDGMLRITIPIQEPALDDEQRARLEALQQDAKCASARVSELEQELRDCRAKAAEAQSALRSAQSDIARALRTSSHALSIQ
jgi:HSP20 family molecular chaperone IbpA